MKITVFCEHNASMDGEEGKRAYPEGMSECLRGIFDNCENSVRLIIHGEHDDGTELNEEVLKNTDVLVWWGHWYHGSVSDKVVSDVFEFVNRGMGLMTLHSAHESKIMKKMLGATGALSWREIGESERVWAILPQHPIAEGIDGKIELEHEEMYGEPFNIPNPDELVFIGWFQGGEVFRSGCVFNRGRGKIFYFQPGHETLPTYKNEKIRRVLNNAVKYVAPRGKISDKNIVSVHIPNPLEKV